jgi:hypothetical protein
MNNNDIHKINVYLLLQWKRLVNQICTRQRAQLHNYMGRVIVVILISINDNQGTLKPAQVPMPADLAALCVDVRPGETEKVVFEDLVMRAGKHVCETNNLM